MRQNISRKDAKAQRQGRKGSRCFFASSFAPLRLCGRLPFLPCLLACLAACTAFVVVRPHRARAADAQDERAALVEAALYTRAEFFGARAFVPYPTAEARNRLADVLAKYPADPEIYLKLARLDEQLARTDDAARELQRYAALSRDGNAALAQLAAFYDRRAAFADEAAVLERLLARASAAERAPLMQRLVELARVHDLPKYLAPEFYEQVIAQDPSAFAIIGQYIDKLIADGDNEAALKVLRAHKARFPARAPELIEKEAGILDSLGRAREAEQVYVAAFDPFWPDTLSDSFYEFLKDHDRFRAYGRELRARYERDPADYDAAVRLIHFSTHAYEPDPGIFLRLERARAARGIKWRPEELATVARMLLAAGYADTASRFLYTLYLQGGLKPGGELRAKVLYELFALLADAGDERLALTKGDLKFYQDIATADPHPGITGGILSLLLSDTDPRFELQQEEDAAVKYFNRAAAYRIFTAYKQEYPTAPELAQMYLDIVRLYTATKEPEVASAALSEFERRYRGAPQFPEVALKLADCYVTLEQYDRERALYQQVLDYLGQHQRAGAALVPVARRVQESADEEKQDEAQQARAISPDAEPASVKPTTVSYPPDSNPGIEIPGHGEPTTANAYYYDRREYKDRLDVPAARWRAGEDERASTVSYAEVLERYVASLAREERTADILALYAAEIKKYPAEQGLYEQMLQWLGQTRLLDEQLRVYQAALKQFPDAVWRDRLARWFLRQQRKQEFADYSRALIARLDDEEVERYLNQFVATNVNAAAPTFEAQLYVGLYARAHERFPHNMGFVTGLLRFYRAHGRWDEWRALVAEHYFAAREIREQFLTHLAQERQLRAHLDTARARCRTQAENDPGALAALPYKLFRADAAAWLSDYEEAIDAYRELNRLYPNTPEYAERLIAFTRSLGEHNRRFLEEAASVSRAVADAAPASVAYRTRAGELQAELGDYARARGEWEQLLALGRGEPETYLETATVYWDYFQYDDALRVIKQLRARTNDETLYAFQVGAILEAQHQRPAALIEYAKELNENAPEHWRARRRLLTLYERKDVPAQLRLAVEQARRGVRADAPLVLGYAALLSEAGQKQEAAALLRREVAASNDPDLLARARSDLADAEDTDGERLALRRLVAVAPAPRARISYRLQLAESYQATGETAAAAAVLSELTAQYPTNYGVLTEAASLYWRLGRRDAALAVLRAGMTRGRGRYHYIFARTLAARELELNHAAAAERVLRALHDENKLNTEVSRELARLYIRTGRRDALRQVFADTLAAIKAQDIDVRELQGQVADQRAQMIEAFTRLKDYRAAVEQHIEIINRDPDDETKLDAALAYVKRYGGADTLLAYYQQTARQAYKNYRWNVVLARIYEAKGDTAAAAANYRAALVNQPEMLELYDVLADMCRRGKDYDGALAALQKAAELSNDDPQYVRKIVALLEQAGRRREADIARQKLPPEPQATPQSVADKFNEAARLRSGERAKAVAVYRYAFDALAAAPYQNELRAADITGYVQTVRDEEALDQIAARLWQLRARFVADADAGEEKLALKARARLEVLDGALPEALGGVAATRATGDELAALARDWQARAEDALKRTSDPHASLALLQNLSRRAGLGPLAERIMLARKDAAFAAGDAEQYHTRVRALVEFYDAAGAYRRCLDLLTTEQARDTARGGFDYAPLVADYARLVGDHERELSALREYYERAGAQTTTLFAQDEPRVTRYFMALLESGAGGRAELQQYAEHPSAHHLRLINFLLAHGEGALAHDAIAHAPLPAAWQLARNAEASLALGETQGDRASYFVAALQLKPIGALVAERPDTSRQLVGDDWYQLAARYGEWLYRTNRADARAESRALLPAQIENRPHDAAEQARLGRWYLAEREPARALEHLRLALAAEPDDKQLHADAGAAYFLSGDKTRARAEWRQIIARGFVARDDLSLYLRTLAAHGLATEARADLLPLLAARLKEAREDQYTYNGDPREKFADYEPLLRELAGSFAGGRADEGEAEAGDKRAAPLSAQAAAAQAALFHQLCAAMPESTALPELIVSAPLVARRELGAFYELLVARSAALGGYERDYDYAGQLEKYWDSGEAEDALDHENDYKVSEPASARLTWQRKYLDYLLAEREAARAQVLVAEIEAELKGRYARPVWLRLAALRLDVRAGRVAQTRAALHRLVGIDAGAHVAAVKPPDTTRLNEAVDMLTAEGQADEADQLLAAAYARAIALAQYDAAYFTGLARLAFTHGDAARARALLQTMLALAQDDTRPAAEAELAAAPWLKPYVVADTTVELPEPSYRINYTDALALAAAEAAEFGQFDVAIDCRQHLRAAAPDDETNRIELPRLLAAAGRDDEALQGLAAVIADRAATRHARWQAVWLAPEICGGQVEALHALRERVAAASKDGEMLTALEALELERAGRGAEARALVAKLDAENPNSYVRALRALLAERSGQAEDAVVNLTGTVVAGQSAEAWSAFGLPAAEQWRRLARLYFAADEPRAALQAAERDESLKPADGSQDGERENADGETDVETNDQSHADDPPRGAFQTLSGRAQASAAAARVELLGMLSRAAEEVGDFKRALGLERARFASLVNGAERHASAARIARLAARRPEVDGAALTVDARFVAQR